MKTNKNLIPKTIIHRPSIWPIAFITAAFAAILVGGGVPTQAADTEPISFTIDTSASGSVNLQPWMNANRQGVNVIKAKQAGLNPNGYFFTATNAQIVTLYKNAGINLFSIGGVGTDTGYPPNTTNDLGNFFSFAQAANIYVNFLLAMSNTTSAGTMAYTNYDETNALFMMQNYSNYVAWLSIGNERDALSTDSDPGWGQSYSGFAEFWPYWNTYYKDIANYLQTHGTPYQISGFGGPDSVPFDPDWAEWFGATNWSVYGLLNNDVYVLTMHYHVFTHSASDTMYDDAISMLSSNVDDTEFPQHEQLLDYANANGYWASFTEFNAYPFDNDPTSTNDYNTGNGYANALFALDAMHWWGQQGLLSLNWLDGDGSFFYVNENGNGVLEAAPIMYGCAAYNEGGGSDAANVYNGGIVAPITGWSNPDGVNNATAYAVEDFGNDGNCTNLYVTLINTTMSKWATNFLADFTVGMPYNNSSKPTHIYSMVLEQGGGDNYVTATNGITLGGADLNGAGPFQPQWRDDGVLNYQFYKATITNCTAQIIKFSCPNN